MRLYKLSELSVSTSFINNVSIELVDLFHYLPFNENEEEVWLLYCNEDCYYNLNPYRLIYNKKIICYLVSKIDYNTIYRQIRKEYDFDLFDTKEQEDNETIENNYIKEEKTNEFYNSEIKSTMVVRSIDNIIERAVNLNASDIHFEPYEGKTKVRMRIDGELCIQNEITESIYEQIVSRIKVLGNMDITKHFVPQDGKISYDYDKVKYDIRVSILPTSYGERLSLRILDNYTKEFSLNDLFVGKKQNILLEEIKKIVNGIILVTGPTGSGKTTTLYSLLKSKISDKVNIITVEDPVEYTIPGVSQVNIDDNVGLGFSETLRSVLRQDPDILMIGEIRDEETANIAIRSAITGHLVFSTLHTNDSIGAIVRLQDMKIPSYLIANAVKAVISQRLVKRLCDNCKKKITITKDKKIIEKYIPIGCQHCNQTGYRGRIGICEILIIDDLVKKRIIEETLSNDTKELSKLGKIKPMNKIMEEAIKEGLIIKEDTID